MSEWMVGVKASKDCLQHLKIKNMVICANELTSKTTVFLNTTLYFN